MAKNQELEEVVLGALVDVLFEKNPNFKILTEEKKELAILMVQATGRTQIDGPYRLRHGYSIFVGNGYDFKNDEAKERYRVAVENLKKLGENIQTEKLVRDGVVGDRFGFYVTQQPN